MQKRADEFIARFHSLEGAKVSERKNIFFKLLHEVAPSLNSDAESLNTIIVNLKPTTHLETLFFLDFLIYFRRTQELLSLLKDGNDIFGSKITNQIWFIQEAFRDISPSELVNDILPCVSFSLRMKILKKLSRYIRCDKFDEIFDALVTRYGMHLASQFILGCSPSKIKQYLTENSDIKLNSAQLQILHRKDPEIIILYFTKDNICGLDHFYKSFLKFLFRNDAELYSRLEKYRHRSFPLGRRATKKVVAVKKDDIISHPRKYEHLNMKVVIKKIGKESVKLFINSLNYKIESISHKEAILQYCPKKYRYSLYMKIVPAHYKIKYEDNPSLINRQLLGIIPDNSERAALAKIKVDKGCDDFIKYLQTQDSIPLIKEKINVTSSIYERGNLVESMIESCQINKDVEALFSVMKYFCFRHKNDDLSVHLEFINNIENLFGFKKFTLEMWTCLNELLAIHTLKFDNTQATYERIQTMPLMNVNFGTSNYQKLSYLEFLFKKGDSIDELIKDYVASSSKKFPSVKTYDKEFVKYFLTFVIENIAKQSDEKADVGFNLNLITELDNFNNFYKNDQLSFYEIPKLLQTFNYVIRNPRTHYNRAIFRTFREKIFTTEPNHYRSEYIEIYFDNFGTKNYSEDLKWFLKYDPQTVVANFTKIFDKLNEKRYSYLWYLFKKFSHLQLPQNAVEKSLTQLNEESAELCKPNLIPCLSILMKPDEFSSLADSYKPENKKLDLTNEKEARLYKLQCAIASNFKNTKDYNTLSVLLKYCVGDYLKDASGSLYSLLHHTSENELLQYFNYLSKKAVSVRKHVLYLSCKLSSNLITVNLMRDLLKNEQNQSLQKYMFSETKTYLKKNPSDSVFELLKLSMNFVTKADEESLIEMARGASSLPKKYRAEYIQHAWNLLEKTVKVQEKLSRYKIYLTRDCSSEEIAAEIPIDFALVIINEFLTSESDIDKFVFIFVKVKAERSVLFDRIFALLEQCEKPSVVFNFLHNWYRRTMEAEHDVKYLEPYVNYFAGKVTFVENFSDYVKLFFLKTKMEDFHLLPIDDFMEKIIAFFEEIVEKCGLHIIQLAAKEINDGLSYFVTAAVKKVDFYYAMIKKRASSSIAVLILQLLKEHTKTDEREYQVFVQTLELIHNMDDVGVRINLLNKFRSVCDSHKTLWELNKK